jgi:acyl dehydratase
MTNPYVSGELFLEDLHLGMRFTSSTHTVEANQIIDFARQFDPQPFHIDPIAARSTLFKGLVASGWHTAAITMRLIVGSVPVAGGVIGVGGEVNWPQPTRPGDILHVEGEIIDIHPSSSRPDRGIVTTRSETLNQRNEIVQNLTAKLVVFRRTVLA